jgi:predicted nucleotidyltransferase
MTPSILETLANRRPDILAAVARHRAANPRLFGSVARGEDTATSDIDLLVEFSPEASLFDLMGLKEDLEKLLGRPTDIVSELGLNPLLRERILRDALPL